MKHLRTVPFFVFLLALVLALSVTPTAQVALAQEARPDIAALRDQLNQQRQAAGIARGDWQIALADFLAQREGRSSTLLVQFAGATGAEALALSGESAALLTERAIVESQVAIEQTLESGGIEVVGAMQSVVNGLIVTVDNAAQVDALRALPNVIGIYPDRPIPALNSTSVPFIEAPAFWQATGLTGEGIKIGIIDDGIDYTHASMGGAGTPAAYDAAFADPTVVEPGTGFPNSKVTGGFDFVGEDWDPFTNDVIVPDPDPIPCDSHGTHVAGSAGAFAVLQNGTPYLGPYDASTDFSQFRVGPGVAPESELYALKTGSCVGFYSTLALIQSLEWSLDNELDVVNMSLGSDYGTGNDILNDAVNVASEAGLLVVISAGNSGDTFYVHGNPAGSERAISVAASVDDGVFAASLTVNVPFSANFFATSAGFGPDLTTNPVTGDVVYAQPFNGCTAYPAGTFTGKVALIDRGVCFFIEKVYNAQLAGAIGVVIVNNNPNPPIPMGGNGVLDPLVTIPSVMIGQADGGRIKTALASSATVNVTLAATTSLGDTAADFTSRGPRISSGNDVFLKPDIAAPGESIISTGVGTGTDGFNFSGTSMAAPHIAGVMGLLVQAYPDLSVEQLKAMVMNTATNDLFAAPGSTDRHSPSRIGAGRVDLGNLADQEGAEVIAFDADRPELVSVSFGVLEVVNTLTLTQQVTVQNLSSTPAVYTVGVDTVLNMEGVTVTASPSSVSVPANGSATVTLTLNADVDDMAFGHVPDPILSLTQSGFPRHWINEESGYLTLTPTSGAAVNLRVPFHAVPRPASAMSGGAPALFAGKTGASAIPLSGTEVFTGASFPFDTASLVTPFTLGITDPKETDGGIDAQADVQYVGVTSDYATGGGDFGPMAFFAITTHYDWSTPAGFPAPVDFYVYIDVDEDGTDDYYLSNWNLGSFQGIEPQDVFVSVLCDLAAGDCFLQDFLNFLPPDFLDTNPFNTNVLYLPVYLVDMGIDETNSDFDYYAATFSIESFAITDVTSVASYDVANEAYSFTGGFTGAPWWFDFNGDAIPVDYDLRGVTNPPSILLLHHHNTDGTRAQVINPALSSAVPPVISFWLIDADTEEVLVAGLSDDFQADLALYETRNLAIEARLAALPVGSVRFGLNNRQNYRIENVAPYALAGDRDGDFAPWDYQLYTPYTVTATAFANPWATGAASTTASVRFMIVDSRLPRVTSFTLINADTDQPIAGFDPLTDGTTLQLESLPTRNLNIRANTVSGAVSVRFAVNNNANFRTENSAPFALAGDTNGNYAAWNYQPRSYTITATPFSGPNGTGTAGIPATIRIIIQRNAP